MQNNNITIECVQKAKGGCSALYLVRKGETIIGQLEKYNDTRTETHPWKAFLGTGATRTYMGAWYKADGAQRAAIAEIINCSEHY